MLERYGIVTRETVLAEGVPGGFSTLYAELGNLELLGTARRGYFVEGLGGAQFALPGAVERLRSLPRRRGLLSAAGRHRSRQSLRCLPALAQSRERPAPGARARRPSSASRRRADRLRRARRPRPAAPRRARGRGARRGDARRWPRRSRAGRLPKLGVEKLDGEPVIGSGHEEALLERRLQPRPAQTDRGGALSARLGDNRSMAETAGRAGPGRAAAQRAALLRPRGGGAGALLAGRGAARLPGRDPGLSRGRSLRRLLHRPLGQLSRHPRALRRPRDHARHAGAGRHLRRAGDARRRGPLGQRRSARRRRAAGPACERSAGACSPATRRSP